MLLNKIYGKIKVNINVAVDTYTYFNYVTDSSSNISYKEIVNLSIHT